MPYWLIALIVVVAMAVAGTAAWTVRRVVPIDALRRHHEMGAAVFLQLGVIFAVLLAFIFNESWNQYNAAADAINQECAALRGAAILAESLPEPARAQIHQAILAYVESVITDGWPAMAHRRISPVSAARARALIGTAAFIPPGNATVEALRPQIMQLLSQAHQNREVRLFQMTEGIPKLVWLLLSLFSLVLISFLFAFGIDYVASQVLFVAVFTAMLSFSLITVRLLDFPFEGPMRLSPEVFQTTLAGLEHLSLAVR